MRKHISQREARNLKRQVARLENILQSQRGRWSSDWPSSTVIGRITPSAETLAQVETARRLKHAVVAVVQGDKIAFFADGL